ncbi:hypothetical protein ACKKBG_A04030 [Auxenochlorella protothecoides x Auxenochlorella symbiontica]
MRRKALPAQHLLHPWGRTPNRPPADLVARDGSIPADLVTLQSMIDDGVILLPYPLQNWPQRNIMNGTNIGGATSEEQHRRSNFESTKKRRLACFAMGGGYLRLWGPGGNTLPFSSSDRLHWWGE